MEPLFTAFATAAFFEFALFAVFELRYLLHAWRARRAGALDPWSAQRELSWLYAQFYGWLLGGIFLTYQLQRCAVTTLSFPCSISHCTVIAHGNMCAWRPPPLGVSRQWTPKKEQCHTYPSSC